MTIKITYTKIYLVISYLIVIFYIFSAVMNTYVGGHVSKIAQLIILLFSLILCLNNMLKGLKKSFFIIMILSFLLLPIIPIFSNNYITTVQSLSFLYCIFLGFILFHNCEKIIPLLFALLILNFTALIVEIIFHIELVIRSDGYDVSSISFLYKMGLFSSPKGGAFFIVTVGLIAFLRKNIFILLIALLSTLLTGVRVSTIVLLFPFLYLFYKQSIKVNHAIFYIPILFVIGISIYFMILFFEDNSQVLQRLFTSLNFEDASNIERFYYWKRHWDIYTNSNIINQLFGNFNYAYSIVGNGSESFFLDLLSNYGFFSILLFIFPHSYLLACNVNFEYIIFLGSIILLTVSGRYCMSYSDAIIYWMIMFTFMNNRKCSI